MRSRPTLQRASRLQALVEGLVSRPPLRQVVAAAESFDGSFRWAGAAGAGPDGARVQEDTPFFLASIDKLLNAVVALKLAEKGLLDLDAALPAYLPSSIVAGLHRLGGVDRSERITVRHLLSHTSGLADWLTDYPRGGPCLFDSVVAGGDRELEIGELASWVRDRLRPHFPPQDPLDPRSRARYCDTNFMLLIAVIETVAAQPLHEVHDRLLLRPIGMRRTYFPGLTQPPEPVPAPAALRAGGRPLQIPRLLRSIRGIYGTTADAIDFMRALVRGEPFERPESLAAMQGCWHRFGFPLDRAALRAPGWPVEYGLGIMRFRLPRIAAPLGPPPPVLGHTGSTGCWLFHCPELDVLLAGSLDEATAGAVPFRVVPRMLRILRDP